MINTSLSKNEHDHDYLEPKYRCKMCHGTGLVAGITKTRGKGMGSAYGFCPACDGMGMIDPENESTK